jgi:SAM-dependent methyltransferase
VTSRLDPDWSLLVCPACRARLDWTETDARCSSCGRTYPVEDGIPILVAPSDRAAPHREHQAEYFDQVPAEFEITRPHGTPPFYRWLIDEKFRRSVAVVDPLLAGATALTVCGGSGMDAEYLARRGAHVYLADVSLGAARRARERADRLGVEIVPVVADAEALPFADRAIDVVYVHDGLHHLERPLAGLSEMARVAARAVSVNEPAQAAATMLAVRVGLSELEEEAGNRIERLRPERIGAELEQRGFRVELLERYAMVYRHEPGRAARLLSRPGVFQLAQFAIRAFNAVAGRVGNKMTVQALRADAARAERSRKR